MPEVIVSDGLILSAMHIYGGGFVKSLADTAERADPVNYERLKAAFPDIWERYADLAKLKYQQEAK